MNSKGQHVIWRSGCGCCSVTRRGFLGACAGCAVAAGTPLAAGSLHAAPASSGKKARVRLVFCRPPKDRPTWPHLGYDFDGRRKEILAMLEAGCPGVEFLPMELVDQTIEDSGVLKGQNDIDGYMVYFTGKPNTGPVNRIMTTGKPTLVGVNLYGGTGRFLTQTTEILGDKWPVDWVSSSKDEDLVASARHFDMLNQGRGAAEVAAAFRAERRRRTAKTLGWDCLEDKVRVAGVDDALKNMGETRILTVGGGWGGDRFRNAARKLFGVTFIPTGFEELAEAYDVADPDASREFAARWTREADTIVEPSEEDVLGSGRMFVAMSDVMKKHGAGGISINCLGGFYSRKLKAYPCLGFSHLNNEGQIGGCEADQYSALTMAVFGALVGRPGFISDPVIDTAKNQVIYAHCVAMTKPFGPDGPTNPYRIRSHAEDGKGAAIQSLLPEDYMTTTLQIDPETRTMLFHQAKSAGNNPSNLACRTKLEGEVKGDIEKLTENWRMGWHRVTFYGDLREPVDALCDRLKIKLIEEA